MKIELNVYDDDGERSTYLTVTEEGDGSCSILGEGYNNVLTSALEVLNEVIGNGYHEAGLSDIQGHA